MISVNEIGVCPHFRQIAGTLAMLPSLGAVVPYLDDWFSKLPSA